MTLSFLEKILTVSSPWVLEDMQVQEAIKVIDVYIGLERGTLLHCPTCGALCKIHDSSIKRVRHLDLCDYRLYLNIKKPRINCGICGIRTSHQDKWSRSGTHYSYKFEQFILRLIKEMSVKAVSRELDEPDNNLWHIFNRYTKVKVKNLDLDSVSRVCVDETAIKRGHKYISIFSDYDTGGVLFVADGRAKEVFDLFFDFILEHNGFPGNIEMFSMDMSVSYQAGRKDYFEKSEVTFDRFHIKKLLNEAVDRVRKEEVKTEAQLKKTKYIWLKNECNLAPEQKLKLVNLLEETTLSTARAYTIKNQFDEIWAVQTKSIEPIMREWMTRALELNLQPITAFVKTISKHFEGVINSIKTGVTNALSEGLNNVMQLARSRARGYRNVNNFINMVYFLGSP